MKRIFFQLLVVLTSLLMCSSLRGDSSKDPIYTKDVILSGTVGLHVSDGVQIPAKGRFKLAVILYQREGVAGASMRIKGEAKLCDEAGRVLGQKTVEQNTAPNQTRLDVWIFEAKELTGVGQKRLELVLTSDGGELQRQYVRAIVFIIPENKRGFLD